MDEYKTIEKYPDGFRVYKYGEYPDWSVLAGQPRKSYQGWFETIEEAKKNHPDALLDGGYDVQNTFGHLPDENGDYCNG